MYEVNTELSIATAAPPSEARERRWDVQAVAVRPNLAALEC